MGLKEIVLGAAIIYTAASCSGIKKIEGMTKTFQEDRICVGVDLNLDGKYEQKAYYSKPKLSSKWKLEYVTIDTDGDDIPDRITYGQNGEYEYKLDKN